MKDSRDPNDFRTFTRVQAIASLNMLDNDDDWDDEFSPSTDYDSMDNEELEGEMCLAGIIHDTDMHGVFDTEDEAAAGLHKALHDYHNE